MKVSEGHDVFGGHGPQHGLQLQRGKRDASVKNISREVYPYGNPRYLTLIGLPGPLDDCCYVLFKPFTLCSYNWRMTIMCVCRPVRAWRQRSERLSTDRSVHDPCHTRATLRHRCRSLAGELLRRPKRKQRHGDDSENTTWSVQYQQCAQKLSTQSTTTPCLRKTVQISCCQNFVKFPLILVICGRKMANVLKLCKVHSSSTSANSHHHTTVSIADVPNCYTTLKVVIFNKLSSDLISTQ